MHIENYVSFTFQDRRINSPYQLVLDKTEGDYAGDISSIREELISKYAAFLGGAEHDNEEKYAFLSYHAAAYKGNPELYLSFVKWTYKELWHENLDVAALEWFRRKIKPVAKGWLAFRHNSFEVAPGTPDDDPRITLMDAGGNPIPAAFIQFWFEGEFLIENKDRDLIMDPDDFDLFMRSWFSGTGDVAAIPSNKPLRTNASGEYVKDVIRRFYQKYGKNRHNKGIRQRFIALMPVTFEKLKSSSLEVLSKTL